MTATQTSQGGQKLKFIHVSSSHRMGLTNQETQLALAYQALGAVEQTVVSGEREQVPGCFAVLRSSGVPFVTIRGFDEHRDFFRLVREFGAVARRSSPEVVTVNTNWQLAIVSMARILTRQPFKIVYTVHGFRHNNPLKSVLARLLIGGLLLVAADAVQAPSAYVRRKFWPLAYKIKSVPLGEDDILFSNSTAPDFGQPLQFNFPGEFRRGKNQEMLIEAFAEYVRRSGDQEATLVLPGTGELRASAQRLALDLDVQTRVLFPGQLNRQQMVQIYQRSQVSIVPTNQETFGHCIAEPLVMKRILLSRPVGIAPEYVEDGKTGFIFRNKKELVELMLAVRSMDRKTLASIAANAGAISARFQWLNVAHANVSLLMRPLLESK